MLTCPTCGRESPDTLAFCPACASSLKPNLLDRKAWKTVTVVFCDVTVSTALGERLAPVSPAALHPLPCTPSPGGPPQRPLAKRLQRRSPSTAPRMPVRMIARTQVRCVSGVAVRARRSAAIGDVVETGAVHALDHAFDR